MTPEERKRAVEILEATPGWFKRDANKHGASVDLRDSSGYRELMGDDFFRFFRIPQHCEGRNVGEWNWTVRRVDGLVNFTAWKTKRG